MTFMTATYELQRPLNPQQLRALAEFSNTYGLRRFHLNDTRDVLQFDYDASRLKEPEVESVLRASHIPVLRRVPPQQTPSS